jgi:hypothetical protein
MLKRLTATWLVLATLMLNPAQAQSIEEANAAFNHYFDAVKVFDTATMANAMHPEAMAQFKDVMDFALLRGPKSAQAQIDLFPILEIASEDAYQQLSGKDIFAKLMGLAAKTQPMLLEVMKDASFSIVSSRIEGDIAFVDFTAAITINGQATHQASMQRLKQHNGEWLLLLPPETEATITALSARYK